MNVSQTCRRTYSLGFMDSGTSIIAPNFSVPWSMRCIQCGSHPMSDSAATICRRGNRSSTPPCTSWLTVRWISWTRTV